MKDLIKRVLRENDELSWIDDTGGIPKHDPLRYEEKCIYYAEYYDMEGLIKQVFKEGFRIENFSIPADLESSNDVTHEIYPELYDQEKFIEWWQGGKDEKYARWSNTPGTGQFMGMLVELGIIPDGEWMIRVSW
jgi:hypothetical protein